MVIPHAVVDETFLPLDIIHAVGRVIRQAAGQQLGTLVIPVFIDESEDADLPSRHGLPWDLC